MSESVARLAADKFVNKDYSTALRIYSDLSNAVGEKFFRLNIELCKKNLVNSGKCYSLCSYPNKKNVHITSNNLKSCSSFKVAMIADEFTYNSYKDEFTAIALEPDTWQEQLEKSKPDVFFCESAWAGLDSKRRPWRGQIYASVRFQKENRTALIGILDYCKKNSIPTIFWNKEDPTHYMDRVHDFVKTSKMFDFVFTSAEECVDKYKKEHGITNAFALPFATNPRIFNPSGATHRSSSIVFAGSWYANHVQRSKDMEFILDCLRNQGFDIEIYDRYYGESDPLHRWPDKYKSFLKPSKPHDCMPEVYKSSCFGLNFNTVIESSTMFARRVFELMSCNTLVLSNYSRGVHEIFGDLVIFIDREPSRLVAFSAKEIDSIREKALNLVLSEHTYTNRWQKILSKIGIPFVPTDERITPVAIIHTQQDATSAIAWFQQHGKALTDANLVLFIDKNHTDLEIARLYQEFNRCNITVISARHAIDYGNVDTYRPIETPIFALFDPQKPPSVDWIKKASLHLKYIHHYAIEPTSCNGMRYKVKIRSSSQTLVGFTSLFTQIVCAGNEPMYVYTV